MARQKPIMAEFVKRSADARACERHMLKLGNSLRGTVARTRDTLATSHELLAKLDRQLRRR